MANYTVLIKGHSGCKLKIIHNDKNVIIEKITYDIKYIDRLEKQASKQNRFYLKKINPFILIPKVLYEKKEYNKYKFGMEFYQAFDFIKILELHDFDHIKLYIDKIIDFIDYNIKLSRNTNVSKNTLYEKVQSVKQNTSKDTLKYFSDIINSLELNISTYEQNINIPIGYCHGDLTFSNILIKNENIILIDFLDSFIETPLQDIVKLRQDTKYKWTLNLLERDIDNTKIDILLTYLDKYIVEHFKKYDFYKHYEIFQKINLLRIIPYIKSKDYKTLETIRKNMNNILE